MRRDPTAAFAKRGPRAVRVLLREAEALVEEGCEKHVRDTMRAELTGAARQAMNTMRRQSWR